MNKFKLIYLLIILFSIIFPFPVIAHGDEEHVHEEETPAPASNTADVSGEKIFTSGKLEVMIKYPEPHSGEAAVFRVFLTDYKSNRAIDGATVSLYFESPAANISPIRQQAEETSTPGIYQVPVTFEKPGKYRLLLGVSKEGLDERFSMDNLAVENPDTVTQGGSGAPDLLLPALAVIMLLLLLLMAYLFFNKSGKLTSKDAA